MVNHNSLLSKVYHLGIEGTHWNLIHTNAQTVIKWDGNFSKKFEIKQGVHQDVRSMRNRCFTDWKNDHGAKKGEIGCAASACTDDVAVASSKPEPLQSLVSTSEDPWSDMSSSW